MMNHQYQTAAQVDRFDTILQEVPKPYEQCISYLLEKMPTMFPPVVFATNPIVLHLNQFSTDALKYLIYDYAHFTTQALHMFFEARVRSYWPKLVEEIDRNLAEELGSKSHGISHLELLRLGHRLDLGLNVDGVSASALTRGFVEEMHSLFRCNDNAYLAGILLAFEAVALDEFRVVSKILRRYAELTGRSWVTGSLTSLYVEGHVGPETGVQSDYEGEAGHYLGLRDAIKGEITVENISRFIQGFLALSLKMAIWWERLAVAARLVEIEGILTPEPVEIPEIVQRVHRAAMAQTSS